jgi:hypothetical protein
MAGEKSYTHVSYSNDPTVDVPERNMAGIYECAKDDQRLKSDAGVALGAGRREIFPLFHRGVQCGKGVVTVIHHLVYGNPSAFARLDQGRRNIAGIEAAFWAACDTLEDAGDAEAELFKESGVGARFLPTKEGETAA